MAENPTKCKGSLRDVVPLMTMMMTMMKGLDRLNLTHNTGEVL